jgi:hypothetical protein
MTIGGAPLRPISRTAPISPAKTSAKSYEVMADDKFVAILLI